MRFLDTELVGFVFFPLIDFGVALNMKPKREAEGTIVDSNTQPFLLYCDTALSTAVMAYLIAASYFNHVFCGFISTECS